MKRRITSYLQYIDELLEKEDIDPWLKDISKTKEILSKPGIALQRKQLQEPLF